MRSKLRDVRAEWLIFTQAAPAVEQNRNDHNYLADYMAERPLYEQAGALVKVLADVPCAATAHATVADASGPACESPKRCVETRLSLDARRGWISRREGRGRARSGSSNAHSTHTQHNTQHTTHKQNPGTKTTYHAQRTTHNAQRTTHNAQRTTHNAQRT